MIELLNRFAANSSDPREYMRAPFTRGKWTYAMNGHIAVRVPKIDGMEILPDKHAPKLEGLFESVCLDACTCIGLASLPPQEECSMCNGTGIAYECEECDGDGEFEHGSHTYTCRECDGSGQVAYGGGIDIACRHCDGTGVTRRKLMKVGGSHFDLFYLHLINGLPGARFSPGAGPMDCAWFVFDGGEGVLMPRRDLAPPVLVHAVPG